MIAFIKKLFWKHVKHEHKWEIIPNTNNMFCKCKLCSIKEFYFGDQPNCD